MVKKFEINLQNPITGHILILTPLDITCKKPLGDYFIIISLLDSAHTLHQADQCYFGRPTHKKSF